eukprot:scaffold324737_cov59-Tisochrysis_lutea.AAC.1
MGLARGVSTCIHLFECDCATQTGGDGSALMTTPTTTRWAHLCICVSGKPSSIDPAEAHSMLGSVRFSTHTFSTREMAKAKADKQCKHKEALSGRDISPSN